MHQGGNKSGERTGKVFVFIYMGALPERDVDEEEEEEVVMVVVVVGKGGGRGTDARREETRGRRKPRERGMESFRAKRDREIPRAIYGMVIEILRTPPPPPYTQNMFVRTTCYRERKRRGRGNNRPSPSPAAEVRVHVVSLGRNNTKRPMSS